MLGEFASRCNGVNPDIALPAGCHGSIEGAKKLLAAAGVVFPRILSIQDHRYQWTLLGRALRNRRQPSEEILDSRTGIVSGIDKPQGIRELPIAKEEGHFSFLRSNEVR